MVITQYLSALRGILRSCREASVQPQAIICARGRGTGAAVLSKQVRAIVAGDRSGIPIVVVETPDQVGDVLRNFNVDLAICRGFPWRLDEHALQAAAVGIINIHPSNLPDLRGPYPVDWAIRRGDELIGVTAHLMEKDIDVGPVLARGTAALTGEDFGAEIWSKVDSVSVHVLKEALLRVREGACGEPQDGSTATYAGAFDPNFEWLNLDESILSAHNKVRAWSLGSQGVLGPLVMMNGRRARVLRSSVVDGSDIQLRFRDGNLSIVEWQNF